MGFPGVDSNGKRDPTTIPALFTVRRRCSIAEINAGVEIIAAIPNYKIRLVDAKAISVGGAASAAVRIQGKQSATDVALVTFAAAQLTQNSVLRAGATGATVLAAGASFVSCDVNTDIKVIKDSGDVATATHVDVEMQYAIES